VHFGLSDIWWQQF